MYMEKPWASNTVMYLIISWDSKMSYSGHIQPSKDMVPQGQG